MVQLDLPAAFAASQLFVYMARKRIAKEAGETGSGKPAIYYRYLFYSVCFAALAVVPAGLYLVCGWPGWEQIYWWRHFEGVMHSGWVRPLFPTLFIIGIVVAGYAGFRLAYHWVVTGRERYIKPTFIGVLLAAALAVAFCYPSFLLVGTYDQYHNIAGQTRASMGKVWENPFDFSYGWIGVMVYFIACFIYAVVKIRREQRV